MCILLQGSPKLPLKLGNALARLRQVAEHIYDVSVESKLDMDLDSTYCIFDFISLLWESFLLMRSL